MHRYQEIQGLWHQLSSSSQVFSIIVFQEERNLFKEVSWLILLWSLKHLKRISVAINTCLIEGTLVICLWITLMKNNSVDLVRWNWGMTLMEEEVEASFNHCIMDTHLDDTISYVIGGSRKWSNPLICFDVTKGIGLSFVLKMWVSCPTSSNHKNFLYQNTLMAFDENNCLQINLAIWHLALIACPWKNSLKLDKW